MQMIYDKYLDSSFKDKFSSQLKKCKKNLVIGEKHKDPSCNLFILSDPFTID